MKNKKKTKEQKPLPALIRECSECGSLNVRYGAKKDELLCLDCGAIFAESAPK